MEIRETEIIINASPSQRKFLQDSRHWPYVEGYIKRDSSGSLGRIRIAVSILPELVKSLEKLKSAIVESGDYAKNQRPVAVVDRIISNIQDAAAAQQRTYQHKSD